MMVEEEKSELDRVQEQINDLLLLQISVKEIQLNPVDYDRLKNELKERSREPITTLTHLFGMKVVSNEEVPISKMYVVKNTSLGPEPIGIVENIKEETENGDDEHSKSEG